MVNEADSALDLIGSFEYNIHKNRAIQTFQIKVIYLFELFCPKI